ncbi:hypothetical protein GQ457_02G031190 [Hibiscus cannabinus]
MLYYANVGVLIGHVCRTRTKAHESLPTWLCWWNTWLCWRNVGLKGASYSLRWKAKEASFRGPKSSDLWDKETVSGRQFIWGVDHLKGNRGVQRFPQAGRRLALEYKGRRKLNCRTYPSSSDEIRPYSHQREGLTPRGRLFTNWGCSMFQGLDCSPIKVVRELGSEHRGTVRSISGVSIRALRRPFPSTRGPGKDAHVVYQLSCPRMTETKGVLCTCGDQVKEVLRIQEKVTTRQALRHPNKPADLKLVPT